MPGPAATLTVPLPELEDCGECARVVHDYLLDRPGVRFVAIDRARREARIELAAEGLAAAEAAALLREALGGAARRPSLAAAHARHAPAHGPRHDHDHHDHGGHGAGLAELARSNRTRLILAAALGTLVVAGQVVGGLAADSLVLLSDAAHMSTDVASIALAAWAVHIAARPATREKSFGWQRSEIVAAFVNALGLWVVSAFFIVEALRRLRSPADVHGGIVLGVGIASLAVNLGLVLLLRRGARGSLNVRSAYLHVLSDVLGSLGAVATGAAILLFGWTWADAALTLLVTLLIVAWTWRLTRQTLHILLEGTPEGTDTEAIRRDVLAVPGVASLHDLHVWSLTTGVHSMSAHVVVQDAARGPDVSRAVRQILRDHGLDHVTLEIEPEGSYCEACA